MLESVANTVRYCRALAVACLLTSAHLAAADTPPWVTSGKTPEYPRAMYLVGSGSGSSEEVARDAAFSSISSQIKTDVSRSSNSTISSYDDDVSNYFQQDTETRSSETLEGVRAVDKFRGEDGEWHVLAVLKIADLHKAREENADRCIVREERRFKEFSEAKDSSSLLRGGIRVALETKECISALEKLESLGGLSSLTAVLASNKNKRKETADVLYSHSESARQALGKLSFVSVCENLDFQSVCDDFTQGMIVVGLTKAQQDSEASFEIKMRVEAEEKENKSSPIKFYHSTFDVEVLDKQQGKVIYKGHFDADAGGGSKNSAINKVSKALIVKARKHFSEVIIYQ